MEWLSNPEIWAALLTLTIMELVLGIDNIVFISLLAGELPHNQQKKATVLGLCLALVMRILLLVSISWVMTLTQPLFNAANWFGLHDSHWQQRLSISGRDLILLLGGLFLLFKSNKEIYDSIEGKTEKHTAQPKSLWGTVLEIGLLDIVFGLDSVITAIGMTDYLGVMIAAVVIAMFFMMLASEKISGFVNQHPSVKLLALAFLLLIGISLIAAAIDEPIAKGYIYFSMAFSIFVVVLILRFSKKKLQIREKLD
jgi:predicted tellurium resistance membrane protein TerC